MPTYLKYRYIFFRFKVGFGVGYGFFFSLAGSGSKEKYWILIPDINPHPDSIINPHTDSMNNRPASGFGEYNTHPDSVNINPDQKHCYQQCKAEDLNEGIVGILALIWVNVIFSQFRQTSVADLLFMHLFDDLKKIFGI